MSPKREREQLQAALLAVLASTDQRLTAIEVYAIIERTFPLSDEQKMHIPRSGSVPMLGENGLDWRQLPQAELRKQVPTEPKWQNIIRWAVKSLRARGLMTSTTRDRRWSLTAAGRRQAAEELGKRTRNSGRSQSHERSSGDLDRLLGIARSMSKEQLAQLLEVAIRITAIV